jgi:hypothetical protein
MAGNSGIRTIRQYRLGIGLLLLFGFFQNPIRGQETGEERLGAWYMYFGTHRLSERLSFHNEAQFRYYDLGGKFNQLLLRAGVNYHGKPGNLYTIGFAYIDTDPFEEPPVPQPGAEQGRNNPEHRIFEQYINRHNLGSLLAEHRFRLEQRFLTPGDTRVTKHRTRYRLQLTKPLSDTYFVNFYDEIFVNLEQEWFGQNRFYLALGRHLNKNLSVQAGYLRNDFSSLTFHRLQFGMFWNADLRKKTN